MSKALKIFAVTYVLVASTVGARRFLAQRDKIIQIEQVNSLLKAAEIQGSVHCDPS